jgi:hypothetical protein
MTVNITCQLELLTSNLPRWFGSGVAQWIQSGTASWLCLNLEEVHRMTVPQKGICVDGVSAWVIHSEVGWVV